MIVFAAIVPHPPASIPEIGRKEEFARMQKTLGSMEILREDLEASRPDVIILISPHAPIDPYSFVINSKSILRGSLHEFGDHRFFEFKNDIGVAELINYACLANEMPAYLHRNLLDHGAIVPLLHLTKNIHPHVVHLSYSMLSFQMHYRYGEIIGQLSEKSSKRIAIIASGDLSHRLSENAPAGFSPSAKFFDQRVIESLGSGDMATLLGLRHEYVEDVAECGLRSFLILLGALHDKNFIFNMLSYEAPSGVGYLVARFV